MIFVLSVFIVLGLYLETGLQLFLYFTDISNNNNDQVNCSDVITNVTSAKEKEDFQIIVSCYITLGLLVFTFTVMNVASVVFTLRWKELLHCQASEKIACTVLHVLQLGLVWRAYCVLFHYSEKAWLRLAALRLVHSSFLTFPYLVLQGRLLFSAENETDERLHRAATSPLPVLALVVSLASCAVSLCAFVLRHKLHEALMLEGADPATKKARRTLAPARVRYAGIFVLMLGTFMCLSARLGSFSLLSAQHGLWVLLPFFGHFFIHATIHFCCWGLSSSSHKENGTYVPEPTHIASINDNVNCRNRESVRANSGGSSASRNHTANDIWEKSYDQVAAINQHRDHHHHRRHSSSRHNPHSHGPPRQHLPHDCAHTSGGSVGTSVHNSLGSGHGCSHDPSAIHMSVINSKVTSVNSHNSAQSPVSHNLAASSTVDYDSAHSARIIFQSASAAHQLAASSSPDSSHHNFTDVTSIPTTPVSTLPHAQSKRHDFSTVNGPREFTSVEDAIAAATTLPSTAAAACSSPEATAGVMGDAGESVCSDSSCQPLKLLTEVARCYLNTVDLVEEDLRRVQCRYVFYYSVVLVENLAMTAAWLLPSTLAYTTKLLVAVTILGTFLAGLVLKFASCGCIVAASRRAGATGRPSAYNGTRSISGTPDLSGSVTRERGDGHSSSHLSMTAVQHTRASRRHGSGGNDLDIDDDEKADDGCTVTIEREIGSSPGIRGKEHSSTNKTLSGSQDTITAALSDPVSSRIHRRRPQQADPATEEERPQVVAEVSASSKSHSFRGKPDIKKTTKTPRKRRRHRSAQSSNQTKLQAKLAPILTNESLLLSEFNHHHQHHQRHHHLLLSEFNHHHHHHQRHHHMLSKSPSTDHADTLWSTETVLDTVSMDPTGNDLRLRRDLEVPATLEDPFLASTFVLECLQEHGRGRRRERSRSEHQSDPRSSMSSKSKHHSDQCSCEGYYLVTERDLSDPERPRKEVFLPRRSLVSSATSGKGGADAYQYLTRCSCRGSPSSTPRRRPQKCAQFLQQQQAAERSARTAWSLDHRSLSSDSKHCQPNKLPTEVVKAERKWRSFGGVAGKDASSSSTGTKNKKKAARFPFGRASRNKDEKENNSAEKHSYICHHNHDHDNHQHLHHQDHHHRRHHHYSQTVRTHHMPGCRLYGYDLGSDRALTWPRRGQNGAVVTDQFRPVKKRRPALPESYVSTEDVVCLWLKGLEPPELPQNIFSDTRFREHIDGEKPRQHGNRIESWTHVQHTNDEELINDYSDNSVRAECNDKDGSSVNGDKKNNEDDDYGFKTALRRKSKLEAATSVDLLPNTTQQNDRVVQMPFSIGGTFQRPGSVLIHQEDTGQENYNVSSKSKTLINDTLSKSPRKPPIPLKLPDQQNKTPNHSRSVLPHYNSTSLASTSRTESQGRPRDHYSDNDSRSGVKGSQEKSASDHESPSSRSYAPRVSSVSLSSVPNSEGSRSTGQGYTPRLKSSETGHTSERIINDSRNGFDFSSSHGSIGSKYPMKHTAMEFDVAKGSPRSDVSLDVDESLV